MNGPETPSTNQYAAAPAYPAPSQQYTPDQSQYVPPLQSWPPQAPQAQQPQQYQQWPQQFQHQAYDHRYVEERKSVVLPWIFVGLGIFIPLSALIAGIWALFQVRKRDARYLWIGIVGITVAVVMVALALQYNSPPDFSSTTPGTPPAQPAQPQATP